MYNTENATIVKDSQVCSVGAAGTCCFKGARIALGGGFQDFGVRRSDCGLWFSLHRYALLRKSKERQALDGLNNLNYFPNVTYDALYKNITVNLTPELALVAEY